LNYEFGLRSSDGKRDRDNGRIGGGFVLCGSGALFEKISEIDLSNGTLGNWFLLFGRWWFVLTFFF